MQNPVLVDPVEHRRQPDYGLVRKDGVVDHDLKQTPVLSERRDLIVLAQGGEDLGALRVAFDALEEGCGPRSGVGRSASVRAAARSSFVAEARVLERR